jgi:hypothetical protein
VVQQTCRSSPYEHVAMNDRNLYRFVSPLRPAKEERGWDAQRNGHDGMGEGSFVPVLMERKPCSGFVPIDETRIWNKWTKANRLCRIMATSKNGGGIGGQGFEVAGSIGPYR